MFKSSFTKLLLALLLVANPVAVLASDLHDVGFKANQTTKETPCDSMVQQEKLSQPAQHDSTGCEMPCCEDSECPEQGICIVQHTSYFITQESLCFNHPGEQYGWDAFIAAVPELEQPPDNPPPILL